MGKDKFISPRKIKKSKDSSSESGSNSSSNDSKRNIRRSNSDSSSSRSRSRTSSNSSSSNSSDEAPARKINISPNKNRDLTVHLRNAEMVAKYRNKNPHVVIDKTETISNFIPDQLEEDDEVWFFDVPSAIDVHKLAGQTIKLGSRNSTIKIGEENVQCVSKTNENSKLCSLVFQTKNGGLSVKSFRSIGHVQLRKSLNDDVEMDIDFNNAKSKTKVPFPEDLKVRHPLHGVKYKKTIDYSPSIKSRLEDAQKASVRVRTASNSHNADDAIAKMEISSPKKSKKRKAERSTGIGLESDNEQTNTIKKVKIEGNTADLDWIKTI